MKTAEERFHEREQKQRKERKDAKAAEKALRRGRMVTPMEASQRHAAVRAKKTIRVPSGRCPSPGQLSTAAKRARRLTEKFHHPETDLRASRKPGRGLFVAKVEKGRAKARAARHARREARS